MPGLALKKTTKVGSVNGLRIWSQVVAVLCLMVLFAPPSDAKFGRKGKNTVSSAERTYKEGLKKMKEDDLDGAIDSFKQATYYARNGYHPEANFWLGICYRNKGENKLAEETLLRCIEQSVEPNPLAWIVVAEIRIDTNQPYTKFREATHKAAMAKASYQQIAYLHGIKAERDNKPGLASGHFHRALGRKPWKWVKVWIKYSECKMKLKKWAEANRLLKGLLDSDNNLKTAQLGRIYHDIGVCKLALGDHQGAIDHWWRALDYNKENREVWLQLGMLFEAEKHYSSAIKYYKEFIRLTPQGPRDPKDPRLQQAKDRVTKIEHMLRPNEAQPLPAKPSPYMRKQVDQSMQRQYRNQQMQQQRQQQMQNQTGGGQDSGF